MMETIWLRTCCRSKRSMPPTSSWSAVTLPIQARSSSCASAALHSPPWAFPYCRFSADTTARKNAWNRGRALPVRATTKRSSGPPYYSFDRGGRHWVLYPNEEGYFSPQDRERKAAWLRRDLEMQPQHGEIVVFVHATPSLSFIEELSRFRVRMVLHGHRHANKAFLHRGMEVASTPPLCFGGADTSARGYRVLDCGPGRINSRFRALHRPLSAATVDAAPALGQRALRKVWEYRLPGELHRAAPACRGRFIVVSSGDGSPGRGSGIHGLEAATGRMRWRQGTESAIKNSVSTDEAGNCAAVSVAGRIYLMDVHSGAGQWTVDLPGYPERWVYSSPAISGAAVFAGSNAGYGAYDLETGEPLWYTSFVGDARPRHRQAFLFQPPCRRRVAGYCATQARPSGLAPQQRPSRLGAPGRRVSILLLAGAGGRSDNMRRRSRQIDRPESEIGRAGLERRHAAR